MNIVEKKREVVKKQKEVKNIKINKNKVKKLVDLIYSSRSHFP
jgi:hypothetical protein